MIHVPGLNLKGEKVFREVKTREQALAYLEYVLAKVQATRARMDAATLVEVQRAAFYELLVRYGTAIGTLTMLMHARMIEDADFDQFGPRIEGAITARVVAKM